MPVTVASFDDPAFGLRRVLDDDCHIEPEMLAALSPELLSRMYREMRRLRLLDERMLTIQRQGRIGFYGEVKGQEATPIATGLALEPDDWIFPALREGAAMLVRGFPLDSYIGQCFGNACDTLKGRQMPSHYSGRQVNQVSWSSCIGPQVPQAVGAAWAMKLSRKSQVAVGFMGDGATSQPDFHNALNFAGVFKVPAVLICQNNHWSISVPSSRQTASPTFAAKAVAYGIPGVRVDGNDVLAVYTVIREAVARARAGHGTTFIECLTYRMGAHSSSDDPTRYRSNEEVEAWGRKDPVDRMRRAMLHHGLLDEARDAELSETLDAEIRASIQRVEQAGQPPRDSIFDDVYAQRPWHIEQQRNELLASSPARGHGE